MAEPTMVEALAAQLRDGLSLMEARISATLKRFETKIDALSSEVASLRAYVQPASPASIASPPAASPASPAPPLRGDADDAPADVSAATPSPMSDSPLRDEAVEFSPEDTEPPAPAPPAASPASPVPPLRGDADDALMDVSAAPPSPTSESSEGMDFAPEDSELQTPPAPPEPPAPPLLGAADDAATDVFAATTDDLAAVTDDLAAATARGLTARALEPTLAAAVPSPAEAGTLSLDLVGAAEGAAQRARDAAKFDACLARLRRWLPDLANARGQFPDRSVGHVDGALDKLAAVGARLHGPAEVVNLAEFVNSGQFLACGTDPTCQEQRGGRVEGLGADVPGGSLFNSVHGVYAGMNLVAALVPGGEAAAAAVIAAMPGDNVAGGKDFLKQPWLSLHASCFIARCVNMARDLTGDKKLKVLTLSRLGDMLVQVGMDARWMSAHNKVYLVEEGKIAKKMPLTTRAGNFRTTASTHTGENLWEVSVRVEGEDTSTSFDVGVGSHFGGSGNAGNDVKLEGVTVVLTRDLLLGKNFRGTKHVTIQRRFLEIERQIDEEGVEDDRRSARRIELFREMIAEEPAFVRALFPYGLETGVARRAGLLPPAPHSAPRAPLVFVPPPRNLLRPGRLPGTFRPTPACAARFALPGAAPAPAAPTPSAAAGGRVAPARFAMPPPPAPAPARFAMPPPRSPLRAPLSKRKPEPTPPKAARGASSPAPSPLRKPAPKKGRGDPAT